MTTSMPTPVPTPTRQHSSDETERTERGLGPELTEAEAVEWDEELDIYDANEVTIWEIVYQTISPTMLIQIRDAATAHQLWMKLSAIHENKGFDDSIQPLKNAIWAVQLPNPDTCLTSGMVISTIYNEYDWHSSEQEVDKVQSNAALGAEMRGRNKGKSGFSGRKGSKPKPKSDKHCSNCDKEGHIYEDCWAPGGPREDKAPYKCCQQQKGKTIATASTKVKLTSKKTALAITAPLLHEEPEAAAAAQTRKLYYGIILDSGASIHMCPDSIGPGDVELSLPMGNGKSTEVMLKNALYTPGTAYSMISVPMLDAKGFKTVTEDGLCTLYMPRPR
ncbi:hypothetical protein DACRYDRAFT_15810 [Dacryopinax primogenitus]|uniref:CCHC-type domain-containing protein n=1 Tax=Dacryopinax primogenitus (strain DJM 731) TaxID=1858805 RepID=M5G7G4_DACPD|nr:uncharacterized protein DACRYDRAFT_15810 [Dacryopinax primogenitus]EJU01802.1 hypothetical protein DACRYDRAFT_15810 [Dacryopinax primogenitus]